MTHIAKWMKEFTQKIKKNLFGLKTASVTQNFMPPLKNITINMKSSAPFKRPERPVTKVFIHCSASDNPNNDNVETIDRWHKARGWVGIGYHFYIDMKGQVFIGRDIEKIPAAQKGHNTGSIAICCGGLNKFTDVQMDALLKFCHEIYMAYGGNITFHGHREVEPNKTCPNFNYKKILNLDSRGYLL